MSDAIHSNTAPHYAAEPALLSLKGVSKSYRRSAVPATALHEIDLEIAQGEAVAIVGKSGSGKTTLINLITGIDSPDSGEIVIAGQAIQQLDQNQLAAWRGRQVGVVFQFFQLLPTLSILENVMLPMDFCNCYPRSERAARALALLEKVGIAAHAAKLPSELSGGQQQRAAIARALANDPPILVADEPTGNLDSHTSDQILQLLSGLAAEGKTVIAVTHEREISRYFKRIVTLADGRICKLVQV